MQSEEQLTSSLYFSSQKPKSQSYTIDSKSSILEQKIREMQTNYAQMESSYAQKIKELKGQLAERARKQANLGSEVSRLREEYLAHQGQISKMAELVMNEQKLKQSNKTAQGQIIGSKKSSSPRLLKKSLQYGKKDPFQKKVSPAAHHPSSNSIAVGSQNSDIPADQQKAKKKAYSPSSNGFNQSKQLILQKDSSNRQMGNNLIKKKSQSPVLLGKGFLINSEKQKIVSNGLGGSPKKTSGRLSPTLGLRKSAKMLPPAVEKVEKKQLVGLKQKMEFFH